MTIVAQPADIVARREDERHAIVDFADQFVGVRRDHRESAYPFAGGRVFPVLPQPAEAERPAILHSNSVGLLRLLTFDRLPLVESVYRQDAAPAAISMPEGRQSVHRLALGIDRLRRITSRSWLGAPFHRGG